VSDTLSCPSCGSENEGGRKFCGECGSALTSACPACGTPNAPGVKFCGECGTALGGGIAVVQAEPRAAQAAERRLVSILFADLVGFTAASEGRDAEETRELLSRYFEICRAVIERYGGVVEKFIGDAVMAVWGTPVATEDDAERAVRAALELVAAMPELHPDVAARAAVLTGEAAVTIGAEAQGMVAGDIVNTASRVQSTADPGTILVDEATRLAADAAIAFEGAGEHLFKGKSKPLPLWRALRVVANRGGEGRSTGLEAPFVGRDRELRLVKELFHATAEERRAHMVLVTGSAGIGKSRLSWEFEKYLDGLTLAAWWHRGRCPAYGEGVAYWALAEMVRGRAGILESEDAAQALVKVSRSVDEHVRDPDDREWALPRLTQLLGLAEASYERDDLFAAWRLFFESLADEQPTILVFEDLQWADAGLLDFIEYLVEWSRPKPIYVVGLARTELAERRPAFGATTRGGFTGLALELLSSDAMDALLEGLVPGLPAELRASIGARAEGIPLYAVETVRMLLNRGQLEEANGAYRLVAEIDTLAVPETLHALVASRIDALEPEERRLVQDAAVLGKTFVVDALASVAGTPTDELEPALQSLVRKEILFLESDPRSAERGQYGFLQDLVRHVAYETLSRRDRKSRHLDAASFFETAFGDREQEVVEVVASHYLTALELETDAEQADELRAKVRETLARAGERAASLGANEEAASSFVRAAELADDPLEEAQLRARAGNAARAFGDSERAREQLGRAIELFEAAGDRAAAARAQADIAFSDFATGRTGEAIERLEASYAALPEDEPDDEGAYLLSQLARWLFFAGRYELSDERNERALDIAERLWLPEVLSHALNTKGLLQLEQGHMETSRALHRRALEIALENDLPGAMMRGYTNLGSLEARLGNLPESDELTLKALELARRVGDREAEWFQLGNLCESYTLSGRWDEVVQTYTEIPPGFEARALGLHMQMAEIARHRGDPQTARKAFGSTAVPAESASLQDRLVHVASEFHALLAENEPRQALGVLEEVRDQLAALPDSFWIDLFIAEAALGTGDVERASDALAAVDSVPPGTAGPVVLALASRFRAQVEAARGDAQRADDNFKRAAAAFAEYGIVFLLACTQLEHAEWLVSGGRHEEAQPLLAEARETFERLEATPWLERVAALSPVPGAPVPTAA
jgi:class 3 adenylate cyclase/tetratricopeptide (TPR) repeat protein